MFIRNYKDYYYISYLDDKYSFDSLSIDNIRDLIISYLNKVKINNNIVGDCEIEVYIDYNKGIIIEINSYNKLNSEDNRLDVKIKINLDCNFLTYVDIDEFDLCDSIYYYDNNFYSNYSKKIDGSIIYKNTNDIINNSIKIK